MPMLKYFNTLLLFYNTIYYLKLLSQDQGNKVLFN